MIVYIEHDGALYRGLSRAWPDEVWNGKAWAPYKGETPKPIDWGTVITEAQAERLKAA